MSITNINRQKLLRRTQYTTNQVADDHKHNQEQQEQQRRIQTRTIKPSQNHTTKPAKRNYTTSEGLQYKQCGKASTRPTNSDSKASAQSELQPTTTAAKHPPKQHSGKISANEEKGGKTSANR